jgi:hypothetical protein
MPNPIYEYESKKTQSTRLFIEHHPEPNPRPNWNLLFSSLSPEMSSMVFTNLYSLMEIDNPDSGPASTSQTNWNQLFSAVPPEIANSLYNEMRTILNE